jgi:hypothetical protein
VVREIALYGLMSWCGSYPRTNEFVRSSVPSPRRVSNPLFRSDHAVGCVTRIGMIEAIATNIEAATTHLGEMATWAAMIVG